MKRPEERNKVTPEYFYDSVAKKTGVSREVVKDIYSKYLSRIVDVARVDSKIVIKGLGRLELDPKKTMAHLYKFNINMLKYQEAFDSGSLGPTLQSQVEKTSRILKHLKKLEKVHGFIKGYIQDFRANHRRFDELFDNEGNCRKSFQSKNEDMQELPIQLGECEDITGVQG